MQEQLNEINQDIESMEAAIFKEQLLKKEALEKGNTEQAARCQTDINSLEFYLNIAIEERKKITE